MTFANNLTSHSKRKERGEENIYLGDGVQPKQHPHSKGAKLCLLQGTTIIQNYRVNENFAQQEDVFQMVANCMRAHVFVNVYRVGKLLDQVS